MKRVVVYHFWSPTCAPCKAIKPMMDDLHEEFDSVEWISVNTHNDSEGVSAKLNVSVVPTVVAVVMDETGNYLSMERHSGTQAAGYYRILRNAIRISQQS